MSAVAGTAPRSISATGPLRRQLRRFTLAAGVTAFAVMIATAFLMPLAYMAATAFKDPNQLTAVGERALRARLASMQAVAKVGQRRLANA